MGCYLFASEVVCCQETVTFWVYLIHNILLCVMQWVVLLLITLLCVSCVYCVGDVDDVFTSDTPETTSPDEYMTTEPQTTEGGFEEHLISSIVPLFQSTTPAPAYHTSGANTVLIGNSPLTLPSQLVGHQSASGRNLLRRNYLCFIGSISNTFTTVLISAACTAFVFAHAV